MQEARVALAEQMYDGQPRSLAQIRLARGFSQQQLASAIGSSQPAIAKIEAGRGGDLRFDTVVRIADALGVKTDELRPFLMSTRRTSDA